ncbi:LysR family transcriptional regulator [Colwellia sp. E2M01]|uniref:LysR family transcriptional regulator n=1 Tax=Colwellia sp. E2M01 TaxID=2841561 RepID=UPI001C0821C9|nr:LysR family transcriptional regulator [Colwellia sp. E2M01]MBU2869581.1 LysR family transcriptional regulator [Colwellia sp. E2M01]
MRHLQDYLFFKTIASAGSIRKAADSLTITSTALNRRLIAIEEELGVELFERLPKGVRLSSAGEVFLHHVREQLIDIERVKSQISDLYGERRGHINIACSQALLPFFLPEQIAKYRHLHPKVTFNVKKRDRGLAEESLRDMSADLAVVFEPQSLADFQILSISRQPTYALVSKDHPLVSKSKIKFSDCLQYPLALPTGQYGLRRILNKKADSLGLKLEPMIESDSFEFLRHSTRFGEYISFQIEIGLPKHLDVMNLKAIPIDERDVPAGILYLAQLKGRTLPVAAAKFSQQLITDLPVSL